MIDEHRIGEVTQPLPHHDSNRDLAEKWAALQQRTTTWPKMEPAAEEIRSLAIRYGKAVEEKDKLLSILETDATDSQENLCLAQEAHSKQRDTLIEFHRAHVDTLQKAFDRDLQELEEEFQEEMLSLEKQHEEEKSELRQLLVGMETFEQTKEREGQELHARVRDVLKRQGEEQLAKLRHSLTSQIDSLVQQLNDEKMFGFTENNDTQNSASGFSTSGAVGKALAAKDQSLTSQIETKVRKIDQELQRWKEWRVKMTTSGKEHSERNQSLFNEKRALSDQYRKLKSHMNKFRQEQYDALQVLNKVAASFLERLDGQVELGLRVLHLAEWAHKKEVEQSRARGLPKAAEGAATSLPSSPHGGDGEGPEKNEENQKGSEELLSAFWRRYNHSLLEKIALLERRDALDEENRALQATLQQYLDGVSISDETLRGANPLLVVQPKAMTPPRSTKPSPWSQNPPIVIEGNHMLQTGRLGTAPFFG